MISILGSTGSIGRGGLRIAERLGLEVAALAAHSNVELLEHQIRRYKPRVAAMFDSAAARDLRLRVADTATVVADGDDGVAFAATQAETCLSAIVGAAALLPTYAAVTGGVRRLALANKESLVCAGDAILNAARLRGVEVIPVDSEHSAIFQCLDGRSDVSKLLLTASGGPFFGYTRAELDRVTVSDALNHPNWSMGRKITVDSATLMNKGLELIEAMRLFGVSPEQVEVLIHRESIIHSMVEFVDGAVIAQLGIPDMTIPIQYALTYPQRVGSDIEPPDFATIGNLSFSKPDTDTFKCLVVAMRASRRGNACCTAMNAANEVAVDAFLSGRLGFNAIADIVERVCFGYDGNAPLDDVLRIDTEARRLANDYIGS